MKVPSKIFKKIPMKTLIFSKVAGFWCATLLNLNFIIAFFKEFDCGFQNNYYPEQVSVTASERHVKSF